MATRQVSIDRQILVQVGKDFLRARYVPPVAHKVTHNGKHANKLDACLLHAGICRVPNELRIGAAGLNVCENRVALCPKRQREEGGAHISCDARNDDLLLSGGFDGGTEVGVVPSTDIR